MEKPRSVVVARGENCEDLYTKLDDWGNVAINGSLVDQLMQDGIRDVQRKAEEAIREKLKEIGFEFKTREDFLQFGKERITRVSNIDHKGTSMLYLDFHSPNAKLICSYVDQYDFKDEDGKIIITWGERIVNT